MSHGRGIGPPFHVVTRDGSQFNVLLGALGHLETSISGASRNFTSCLGRLAILKRRYPGRVAILRIAWGAWPSFNVTIRGEPPFCVRARTMRIFNVAPGAGLYGVTCYPLLPTKREERKKEEGRKKKEGKKERRKQVERKKKEERRKKNEGDRPVRHSQSGAEGYVTPFFHSANFIRFHSGYEVQTFFSRSGSRERQHLGSTVEMEIARALFAKQRP